MPDQPSRRLAALDLESAPKRETMGLVRRLQITSDAGPEAAVVQLLLPEGRTIAEQNEAVAEYEEVGGAASYDALLMVFEALAPEAREHQHPRARFDPARGPWYYCLCDDEELGLADDGMTCGTVALRRLFDGAVLTFAAGRGELAVCVEFFEPPGAPPARATLSCLAGGQWRVAESTIEWLKAAPPASDDGKSGSELAAWMQKAGGILSSH